VNRQTKRMLQRQGQLGPDGTPLAPERERQGPRQPQRGPAGRGPVGAPPGRQTRESVVTRLGNGLKEVRGELRKVAWGTRDEVRNYTTVVIVTLIILVSFVFLLNLAFSKAVSALFGT
jgi:preprotein translocase subunit SecE